MLRENSFGYIFVSSFNELHCLQFSSQSTVGFVAFIESVVGSEWDFLDLLHSFHLQLSYFCKSSYFVQGQLWRFGEIAADKILKLQRDDDKLQKLDKCSRSKKDVDGGGQIVELQKIETTLACSWASSAAGCNPRLSENIKITFTLRITFF